jgi:hypothetical protein
VDTFPPMVVVMNKNNKIPTILCTRLWLEHSISHIRI